MTLTKVTLIQAGVASNSVLQVVWIETLQINTNKGHISDEEDMQNKFIASVSTVLDGFHPSTDRVKRKSIENHINSVATLNLSPARI